MPAHSVSFARCGADLSIQLQPSTGTRRRASERRQRQRRERAGESPCHCIATPLVCCSSAGEPTLLASAPNHLHLPSRLDSRSLSDLAANHTRRPRPVSITPARRHLEPSTSSASHSHHAHSPPPATETTINTSHSHNYRAHCCPRPSSPTAFLLILQP